MNRAETEIILSTCFINIRGLNTAPSFDHNLWLDYKFSQFMTTVAIQTTASPNLFQENPLKKLVLPMEQ